MPVPEPRRAKRHTQSLGRPRRDSKMAAARSSRSDRPEGDADEPRPSNRRWLTRRRGSASTRSRRRRRGSRARTFERSSRTKLAAIKRADAESASASATPSSRLRRARDGGGRRAGARRRAAGASRRASADASTPSTPRSRGGARGGGDERRRDPRRWRTRESEEEEEPTRSYVLCHTGSLRTYLRDARVLFVVCLSWILVSTYIGRSCSDEARGPRHVPGA